MAEKPTPTEILSISLTRAIDAGEKSLVDDPTIRKRIELVARTMQNRSGVRLIMACALAAIDKPWVDIRKPYTEIQGDDTFSGRSYDESYLTRFFHENRLPGNSTTAFLTPALRNQSSVLVPGLNLVGRPAAMYQAALELLDDVYQARLTAETLLTETIRYLVLMREEQDQRMASLLKALQPTKGDTSISSEGIVTLIEQHLHLPRSSRLPTLIVAAAYKAAEALLGEQAITLLSHNAADSQTGALGDVEITLMNDEQVVTCYEMKMKLVTREDIEIGVRKVAETQIDNYIFITTEPIDPLVQDYARSLYDSTGIEFVVLDCISFIRHFLHLFHRVRLRFLEEYQALLLEQPDSSVNQALKEVFLTMRLAAESRE